MSEDSYFKEILSLSVAANMRPAPPIVSPHEPASTVMERKIRVAYVSTYPPRKCGIATYTKRLVEAASWFCSRAVTSPVIVAVNDRGAHYDYEIRVKAQIDADDIHSYEKVAQYLNASDVDVVNLQHEYGIYGGEWGEYVTEFLHMIRKPVVTTLHTLLEEPASRCKESIGTNP